MKSITLVRLIQDDREEFIKDNQEAFNFGALEEFGRRDDHFEEDGEIISRETIEHSIDGGEAYRIMQDGKPVGGVVIKTDGEHGDLDLLFVSPHVHSKGIGYAAWCMVEKLHPEVTVWETVTPYFEKRNIHFYVNRCGFHIVEFFNSHHPDPNDPDTSGQMGEQFQDGMFRLEKNMRNFMANRKIYQVSTLQALALGFSKSVITVEELLGHGDMGLGTFEDVDGEMILLDGRCYRARNDGSVLVAENERGVPFASACRFQPQRLEKLGKMDTIEQLKEWLMLRIEEDFALNSMHMVRIDGEFSKVDARSESGTKAHHVTLKDALSVTQKAFVFENIKGTLVCVYYPDYMDGINAPGWHLHFLSEDKKCGGHVFDISLIQGDAAFCRITSIEIQIPDTPAFDTYALKNASKDEIKSVEQGKHQ